MVAKLLARDQWKGADAIRSHVPRSILISTKDLLHYEHKYYQSHKALKTIDEFNLQACYTRTCQATFRFLSQFILNKAFLG